MIHYCAEALDIDDVCANSMDPIDVSVSWHFKKRFKYNLLRRL